MATHTNSIIANILEILNNIYLLGQEMKTTVIIPAYKAEGFIDEAIMSIVSQKGLGSDDTLRLIVVCDGCENTYEIAKKHSS